MSRRARGCLSRLAAVGIGLVLGCAALEIGVRIMLAQQIRAAREDPETNQIYTLFEADPDLGWSHRPGAQSTISNLPDQAPYEVSISEKGLYDLDYPYERPAGGFRALVVGDSFVENVQVALSRRAFQSLEDGYAANSDAPYEIIEMGVARYSPSQYYRAYQLEGRRYAPDLVIVVIYLGNDLDEMHPDGAHNVIAGIAERDRQLTLEDGALVEVEASRWQPPDGVRASMPLLRRAHIALDQNLTLYRLFAAGRIEPSMLAHRLGAAGGTIPLAGHFEAGYEDPLIAEVWPIFAAVIAALRDAAEADGAQFAAVIAPEMYAVHQAWYFEDYPQVEPYRARFDPDKLETRVAALLETLDCPYLSLTPALRDAAESGEPVYYRANTHWSPAGHVAVAAALSAWFEEMGWTP